MASVLEKVAKTVGLRIACAFEKAPLIETGVKPFKEMFSRSEKSFWFIKIKPEGYKESGLINASKKFLLIMEGLALYYSIIERAKDSVNLTFALPQNNLDVNNFLANCRKYYGNTSNIKPEYICLEISVDLYGDKSMILPDTNKRIIAETYAGRHEHLKVR
jgi:hypothetical protein